MFNFAYNYSYHNAPENSKKAVWRKGTPIPGKEPDIWRLDACNHAMKYSDHGNTGSQYGWEIDHIYPKSRGGSDDLANLQPLYWENNRRKGDNYPWYCENAA
jgi:hypothetical protein